MFACKQHNKLKAKKKKGKFKKSVRGRDLFSDYFLKKIWLFFTRNRTNFLRSHHSIRFFLLLFFQLFACPSFLDLACNIFFFCWLRVSDKEDGREREREEKKVSISLQSKVLPHYKSLFRLFNYISQNELRYRQENESGWDVWRRRVGEKEKCFKQSHKRENKEGILTLFLFSSFRHSHCCSTTSFCQQHGRRKIIKILWNRIMRATSWKVTAKKIFKISSAMWQKSCFSYLKIWVKQQKCEIRYEKIG